MVTCGDVQSPPRFPSLGSSIPKLFGTTHFFYSVDLNQSIILFRVKTHKTTHRTQNWDWQNIQRKKSTVQEKILLDKSHIQPTHPACRLLNINIKLLGHDSIHCLKTCFALCRIVVKLWRPVINKISVILNSPLLWPEIIVTNADVRSVCGKQPSCIRIYSACIHLPWCWLFIAYCIWGLLPSCSVRSALSKK